MEIGLLATLFGLGLVGGFASGLFGLGGGIIMVPLLLYVPPALGVGALAMKVVAGMTSVQSFAGAVSGAVGHKRYNRICYPLAISLGGSLFAGSLIGSLASAHLDDRTMLAVFAGMAMAASLMLLLPKREDGEEPDPSTLQFNKPLSITVGLLVGLLAGIVGQGGAFLFIPAMLYILNIPMRITIGTALVVGIASSVAVLIGRLGTAQVPFMMSAVLVAGVLLGAQFGAAWSQRTPRHVLRTVLSLLIMGTAMKLWHGLLV